MDIKILVAAHKPYRMPEDEIYLPIQVGKAGKEPIGYTGDDTGENISEKNPHFCELTAIYWAWKNLQADYIGLVHYRRYFSLKKKGKDKFDRILTGEEARTLVAGTDVIVPKPRNYRIETIRSHYEHYTHTRKQDLDCLQAVIEEKYPDYMEGFNTVTNRTWAHMFNMFLLKKELFDRYCAWLFDILFEVERRTDLTGLDFQTARVYGYLGELMLDIFLETNHIPYVEVPVCFMEGQNWAKKGASFLKRKLFHS